MATIRLSSRFLVAATIVVAFLVLFTGRLVDASWLIDVGLAVLIVSGLLAVFARPRPIPIHEYFAGESDEPNFDSEPTTQNVMEATLDGLWKWNVQTGHVFFSAQWARLLGYEPHEVPSRVEFFFKVLHPDDVERVSKLTNEHLEGLSPIKQTEVRLLTKGGEYRWFLDRGKVVARDVAGKATRMVGTITDITEQKKNERRIDTYARLAHDLNTAESVIDASRLIANAAADLIGWDSAFLVMFSDKLGTSHSILNIDLVDGQKREVPIEMTDARLSAHVRATLDHGARLVLRHDPGELADRIEPSGARSRPSASLIFVPIRDGRTTVGVCSIQSYSVDMYRSADLETLQSLADYCGGALSRIVSREALDVSERRMREAQSISHIGSFFWDARTNRVTWSDELFRIYGREPGSFEPTFESYIAAIHPEDRERVQIALQGVMASKGSFDHEYRLPLPGGEERWVRARGVVTTDPNGQLIGIEGTCQNITERKLVEATLRISHTALKSVSQGVLIINREGTILAANPAFTAITGFDEAEILGKPCATLRNQKADAGTRERIALALQDGVEFAEEVLDHRKDGTPYWNDMTISPVRDVRGEITHFVSISRDVSARKRTESAMKESEEKFRTLFETSGDAIFLMNGELFVDCNARAVEMFGCQSRAQIVGRPPTVFSPPTQPDGRRSIDVARERIGTALSGKPQFFEWEHATIAGVPFPAEVSLNAVELSGKQVLQAIVRDVTARKESERARSQSLSLMKATLESTADGILVVDRTGRIVTFNRVFAQMWRLPDEVLESRSDDRALQFVLEQLADPESFAKKVQHLYDHPELESFDTVKLKDGRAFERFSRPQYIDGQVVGRLWSYRDITERMRLEDQLRHSQKMEAIGLLAGGVAHDFNNLLTVINGHSELLLMTTGENDARVASMTAVREAGERAAKLTAQLLAFSRKAIVEPQIVDVNMVVQSAASVLRRLIGEDIRFDTSLTLQLAKVKIDPGQLEQVLFNLVVNSRDAMPRGGRIKLRTSDCHLSETTAIDSGDCPPGHYAEITVSDNGQGMSEEVRRRIFEPYFTTKSIGKGTGLGLATVYGIVIQAGGAIGVESRIGSGTTIRVLLPAVAGRAHVAAVDPLVKAPTGTETILLAEDEAGVRKLARISLEKYGYRVLEADGAAMAIRLEASHDGPIDLLVTDVVMPDMGGRELAEAIRKVRPEIAVLFVSGYTDDAVIRHGVEVSEDAFLQKPYTPITLACKVRAVLDDSRTDASSSSSELVPG